MPSVIIMVTCDVTREISVGSTTPLCQQEQICVFSGTAQMLENWGWCHFEYLTLRCRKIFPNGFLCGYHKVPGHNIPKPQAHCTTVSGFTRSRKRLCQKWAVFENREFPFLCKPWNMCTFKILLADVVVLSPVVTLEKTVCKNLSLEES